MQTGKNYTSHLLTHVVIHQQILLVPSWKYIQYLTSPPCLHCHHHHHSPSLAEASSLAPLPLPLPCCLSSTQQPKEKIGTR